MVYNIVGKKISKAEVSNDEAKQQGHKKSPKKESSIPVFASCSFCTRCNEEFNLHFKLISSSDITVGEERNHLISLIKKKRKFLVKRLVLQMTGLWIGKSKVFKSLSAQYLKLKEDKARILEEQGSGVVLEN